MYNSNNFYVRKLLNIYWTVENTWTLKVNRKQLAEVAIK